MKPKRRLDTAQATLGAQVEQQLMLQTEKDRARSLKHYEQYLFGAGDNALRKFIIQMTGARNFAELLRHINGMSGGATWTDMGGGHAIAMREARQTRVASRIRCINVDLLGSHNLPLDRAEYSDLMFFISRTILRRAYQPQFLQADAQTVSLPRAVALCTSIQSWQYMDQKTAALAHWYNTLADGGLMFLACDTSFSSLAQPNDGPDSWFLNTLCQALDQAGIPYAYDCHCIQQDPRVEVDALAIARTPGTSMITASQLQAVRIEPDSNYVITSYDAGLPAIQVVRQR